MNYTLQEIIGALSYFEITIDGTEALLTRQLYIDKYPNQINTELFVPILYYNITELSVNIVNTDVLTFTGYDLFSANDWVCMNRTN